jgi:hypothetical protein
MDNVYINNVSSSGTLEAVLFTFYQYNWLFYEIDTLLN